MSLFPQMEKQADFAKLNKLIYGFPKTGKSTFASLMKDKEGKPPAFITTEDGHGALAVNARRVTSWDGFLRLVAGIKAEEAGIKSQFSCFVIDLVSDLDEMCASFVCKQHNVKSLGDLEHGKGWFIHKTQFRAALNELSGVLPVSYICHSVEKEVNWNNEKIKVQSPDLGKQCLAFVNGKVDLIMWIAPANSKKEYPELIMKNTTTCLAGSRFPQLVRNFTFKPDKLEDTYLEISKIFAAGAVEETKPSQEGVTQ